jgi:Tfp pilus assembly protein PilF
MKTSSKSTRRTAPVAKPAPKPEPAPAPPSNFRRYALPGAIVLIAVFTVYGPALNGPFLLDDTTLPYMQPQYASAPLMSWIKGIRPMLMLTYWMNFQSSGTDTGPYHFVNVVLHIVNGLLILLSLLKLLRWANPEAQQNELFAGFAAWLFLLHPLQTESVSYVASRSETLSVCFFLTAFTVFLYRKNTSASLTTGVSILLLFGAACLSKEHTAVLPALLLLTDYYWNPGFSFMGIRRNWKIYVPMFVAAVIGLIFVWRVLSSATTAGFAMKDLTWYQYFFTECRAIWRYVLLFIFPFGQNLDYDFPVSHNIFEHGAIIGVVGVIALIAAAWWFRRRFPLESYGILAFLLLLAPTSSFIPIRDTLVERRMYLPFIGLLLVTIGLLRRWKTPRSTLITTLVVVLLIEAGIAFQRNQLWGNAVDIWKDSVAKSPSKVRPRFQLAYAYYNAGRCDDAVIEFGKTAQLDKPEYSLLIDWALSYDCAGNPSAAIDKLTQAAALEPTGHVYSQIGMEYAKQGKYPQALDALETAARLDPNFEMTYVYRGNVYSLQGNKARAVEEYRRALAIDPQNQTARDGLVRLSR